jgi:hypothetical protein
VVTSALASKASKKHVAKQPTGLAVFLHQRKTAHAASTNPLAPPGAVLATVVGQTEVYASQITQGSGGATEDCVTHFTGHAGGGVCASAAKVENEGIVGVGGPQGVVRITALLPNGVKSVKITDNDGATYEVAVTNNVVEHEDSNAVTFTYALPGNQIHTTNIAKLLANPPRQPGAAGSQQ